MWSMVVSLVSTMGRGLTKALRVLMMDGVVYVIPVLSTIKAVVTRDKSSYHPFLIYWSTVYLLRILNTVCFSTITSTPFLHPYLQTLCWIWLAHPQGRGAHTLYRRIVAPLLLDPYEEVLDGWLCRLNAKVRGVVLRVLTRGGEYVARRMILGGLELSQHEENVTPELRQASTMTLETVDSRDSLEEEDECLGSFDKEQNEVNATEEEEEKEKEVQEEEEEEEDEEDEEDDEDEEDEDEEQDEGDEEMEDEEDEEVQDKEDEEMEEEEKEVQEENVNTDTPAKSSLHKNDAQNDNHNIPPNNQDEQDILRTTSFLDESTTSSSSSQEWNADMDMLQTSSEGDARVDSAARNNTLELSVFCAYEVKPCNKSVNVHTTGEGEAKKDDNEESNHAAHPTTTTTTNTIQSAFTMDDLPATAYKPYTLVLPDPSTNLVFYSVHTCTTTTIAEGESSVEVMDQSDHHDATPLVIPCSHVTNVQASGPASICIVATLPLVEEGNEDDDSDDDDGDGANHNTQQAAKKVVLDMVLAPKSDTEECEDESAEPWSRDAVLERLQQMCRLELSC